MIEKKFSYENYIGNEDFVFMRCVKADSAKATMFAERMVVAGIKLFFDIQGNKDSENPGTIAKAIKQSETVLFFMSKKACDSLEFRNNINFALEQKKHIVCIRLDNEEFTHGLDMQLANIPTIEYNDYEKLENKLEELEVITQDVLGATPVKINVNKTKQLILATVIVVVIIGFAFGANAIIRNRIQYYNSAEYMFRDADGSDYLNVSKYAEEAIKVLEGKKVKELDFTGSEINSLEGIQKIDIEILNIADCNNLRRIDQLQGCPNLHTVRINQNLINLIPESLGHIEFEIVR